MIQRPALPAAILALAVASCAATPPRHEHRAPEGTVRSFDPEGARQVSSLAQELAPGVRGRLGVASDAPFEIWHVRRPLGRIDAGLVVERDRRGAPTAMRVEIGEEAYRALPRYVVAHELVHWYMRGTIWDRLPLVVEEGIAEFVAMDLDPESAASRKGQLVARLANLDPDGRAQAMGARRGAWSRRPRGEGSAIYAVGHDLVQRLGLEALRAMGERARSESLDEVPLDWIEQALRESACPVCGELPKWVWVGVIAPLHPEDVAEFTVTLEGLAPEGDPVTVRVAPELKCACGPAPGAGSTWTAPAGHGIALDPRGEGHRGTSAWIAILAAGDPPRPDRSPAGPRWANLLPPSPRCP